RSTTCSRRSPARWPPLISTSSKTVPGRDERTPILALRGVSVDSVRRRYGHSGGTVGKDDFSVSRRKLLQGAGVLTGAAAITGLGGLPALGQTGGSPDLGTDNSAHGQGTGAGDVSAAAVTAGLSYRTYGQFAFQPNIFANGYTVSGTGCYC